jgi:folylpolyglutamate synthase
LAGKHQYENATLAVELSRTFIEKQNALDDKAELPQTFVEGLRAAKWPGRCQIVPDPTERSLTWYLDGAHTLESLDCCMDWFLNPDIGLGAQKTL